MVKRVLRFQVLFTLVAMLFTLRLRFGPMSIYTVDLALIPLIASVAAARLLLPRHFEVRWHCVDLVVIGLMGAVVLSILFSFDAVHSLEDLVTWLRFAAFYLCCRVLFDSHVLSASIVGRHWVIAAIVLIAVGSIQVLTASQFGLISNYFGDTTVRYGVIYRDIARLSGTVRNPNVYALWLTLFATFAAFWLVNRGRVLNGTLILVVGLCLVFLTLSRGAIASFVLLTGVLCALTIQRRPTFRYILVIGGLLTAVGIGAIRLHAPLEALLYRFATDTGGGRIDMMRHGVKLLREPKVLIVGIGPGTFHQVLDRRGVSIAPGPLQRREPSEIRSGIHNTPLQLLVEHGGVFFVLGFSILWLTVWSAVQTRRMDEDPQRVLWANYIIALAIAFSAVALQVYEEPTEHYLLLPSAMLVATVIAIRRERLRTLAATSPTWSTREDRRVPAPARRAFAGA